MPDDNWKQDEAWAEPGPWEDPGAGDGDWAADVRTGSAHYMQGHPLSLPQSGIGIASLVFSIIAGVMMVVTMIAAAMIMVQNPNVAEDDPRIVGVGCGILVGLALAVLAGILGVIALFQPERAKTCAVLGIVFSGLEVVGVVGMILLGLAVG